MPKPKRNTNDVEHLSDYFSDIDEWPNDWMAVEEDLEIGRGLLTLFMLTRGWPERRSKTTDII